MHKVILLIGGNEGQRIENIQEVKNKIDTQIGSIIQESSLYESEPWGFEHHQNFINQVLEVSTQLSPSEVLQRGQSIEKELGRRPKKKLTYEARTMDIDILFYDDVRQEAVALTIPHPKLQERLFTLLPLNEKWGKYTHPVLNKTIEQLLDECDDVGWVKKII
ncbi:2-amino-4-hydroxy-6-hydroxymethyldihydropteridine diphosphokinase [Saccharicrinis fermentans]|uniref:2-amino-4-hydroxy-6-hydroxymethyldihydropteridine pyrophosphokinase n=1 Tax=Saccharicrinis fermentans DSM 9555 = JCM 21142 TaxID=869213 RepID=W7Y5M5_9BACT|nr:2-amino-4-hydroxy-6-hydroxymethyldihydropteridine diphosphokinase [Saccharicrinis fermentans]GAF03427.1 bifunctional folate synthesis protein [Saccharicrinis fermentans DSM 9555 = JCM 21142]